MLSSPYLDLTSNSRLPSSPLPKSQLNQNTYYTLSTVTDPNNPENKEQVKQLKEIVKANRLQIQTSNLANSLHYYQIFIEYNNEIDHLVTETIVRLMNDITYVAVEVVVDISELKQFTTFANIITGHRDIILHTVEKVLQIHVDSVEWYYLNSDHIVYTPMSNNSLVWANSAYMGQITAMLKPLYWSTPYRYLTDDPLVQYAFTLLKERYNYTHEDIHPVILNGDKSYNIVLIPVGRTRISHNTYNEIYTLTLNIINELRLTNYFTYDISISSLSDLEFIRDLAELWNIDIVMNDLINIAMKTSDDFYVTPKKWLKDNLQLIRKGELPQIVLTGSWQSEWDDDYLQVYGMENKQQYIEYSALRAYARLAQDNIILKNTIKDVTVNPDYSISLRVDTRDQANTFIELFQEEWQDGLMYSDTDMTDVVLINDIDTGIALRLYVNSKDPDAISVILSSNNKWWFVYRSPLVIEYPQPLDFSINNIKTIRTEWSDQVTQVKTNNDMNSLMGYYDILDDNQNILSGLVDHKINIKELRVPVNVGQIRVNNKKDIKIWSVNAVFTISNPTTKETELLNNIKTTTIANTLPLFDIKLEPSLIPDLQTKLTMLWMSGWFLTPWSFSVLEYYQKHDKDIDLLPIVVTNQVLLWASGSTTDGLNAYNKIMSS